MTQRDPNDWMWTRAAEWLLRAERVQRQFYLRSGTKAPTWEPPIDVFETEDELGIVVALPGVVPDEIEVAFENGELLIAAERTLPDECKRASLRRLEIPQGRIERRIALPPGHYRLEEQSSRDGCLYLRLKKLW
jgi:HSP20 family molecular chaperone IbpA